MATDTQYATSHITGSFTTPGNAVGSTSGTWTADTGTADPDSRWAMGNTAITPAGTGQSCTVRVRKDASGGSDPDIAVELWENGVFDSTILSSFTVTSATGEDATGTFDAAGISNWDDVEIRINATSAGGGPNARTAQVDYIRLDLNTGPNETQSAFRFRPNDDALLNDNGAGDWAAAVNTNWTTHSPGTRFRLRIEIEETDGAGQSRQYKLQHKIGAGAWTDTPADLGDPGGFGPSVSPIRIVYSQITDGAATTDILTGAGTSSETFTAGNGNDVDGTTAAVTIDALHSEFEFALYILPCDVAHNETIQFRLVYSDGTTLPGGYTNTPQLTVVNNTGEVGGAMVETLGAIGPFEDGNGNLYMLGERQDIPAAYVQLFKSTNDGLTWIAATDHSIGGDSWTDLEGVDVVYYNHELHIVHIKTHVEYWVYRCSSHATNPDTWRVQDERLQADTTGAEDVVGIAARSDGTVVCAYQASPASGFEQINYKIRSSGGTWGSAQNLDTTASTSFSDVKIVKGASDKVHMFYFDTTNDDVYHKSLTSGDSLSSREQCGTTATYTDECPLVKPVYWDDAGTEKVMVGFLDSAQKIRTVTISNDGTPGTEKLASDNTVVSNPGATDTEQPSAFLAVDASDNIYLVYADATTNDLYYTKSVNDGAWATDIEIEDAITAYQVAGNVINTNELGFFVATGENDLTGEIYFNTYTVAAAAAVYPPYPRRQLTTVRM